MKRFLLLTALVFTALINVFPQEEIMLYPEGAAESNELKTDEKWRDKDFLMDVSRARMYAYLAPKEKANGTAVVICPGGGYAGLSTSKEGRKIAEWYNNLGISAFVLYYRMPNKHPYIPLKDTQTALSIVNKNARRWNINPKKIGIMGFSAGGHLASTTGTHFKKKSERPAFMVLAYPVISMEDGITHNGSKENLLGKNPSKKITAEFSNERRVTKQTPKTFIVHSIDDQAVPVENSKRFHCALLKNKVRSEILLTQSGGHGFGMEKRGTDSDGWEEQLKVWLKKKI